MRGKWLWVIGGAAVMLFLFGRYTSTGKRIMNTITQAGIDMIAHFEGFSATPYNDPPGSDKWSIGYGHQILPGENFTSITVEQGKALLAQDTAKAQAAVRSAVKVPLTTAQFDALTSFVFNVGVGAFKNGSVPAKLNANNFAAAAATMRQYNKVRNPQGILEPNANLTARRDQEASAFA